MKVEGLKFFTDITLTNIGILLFFSCFCAFILWIYRRGAKSFYNQMAQIPLMEPTDIKESGRGTTQR